MNKPLYLGMSILDINKTLMYNFCYDYFKPKQHTHMEQMLLKYVKVKC